MPKNVVQCKEDRSEKEATLKYLGGHSITTLTKFCLIVDHLPIINIGERISVLLYGEICIALTFPVAPTYLPRLVNVV